MRNRLNSFSKSRLKLLLGLFFLALAIPTTLLLYKTFDQLKWEAFHQHQQFAEELALRIDNRFLAAMSAEEERSFANYSFLNIEGELSANYLQRSPLSAYPVSSDLPGLIGYFQIDSNGLFTTPLLPKSAAESRRYGIDSDEYQQRLTLQNRIEQILGDNRLVKRRRIEHDRQALAAAKPAVPAAPAASGSFFSREIEEMVTSPLSPPAEAPTLSSIDTRKGEASGKDREIAAQAAFDQLNRTLSSKSKVAPEKKQRSLGRVEDLKLEQRYQGKDELESIGDRIQQRAQAPRPRTARKELGALPEQSIISLDDVAEPIDRDEIRAPITTFESEIDPFEISLLDSGHFVLFRKVWRNGDRFIQGALIEQQPLLKGLIEPIYRETALSQMSDLAVAYHGDIFTLLSSSASNSYLSRGAGLRGELLYQSRLSAPLSEMELLFSITHLPPGPAADVVFWIGAVLSIVLCGGFLLLYRLGAGQIELARKQQDFVSAVSHELKTPLTSIRMYGEMLREGWTSEEKKRSYYDYIYTESERLSRLIDNVLQLARMRRNDLRIKLQATTVSELLDTIQSKCATQIEAAGFELEIGHDGECNGRVIDIDRDAFTQIIINLVDNAIKFSAKADKRRVEIDCKRLRQQRIQFSVRDFGPGIAPNQMKKIFRLFYRSESELTRETVGTGIGLALVEQLCREMGGEIDVINREPGSEFTLTFHTSTTSQVE